MNVVWGLVAFTDRYVFVERDLVWATLSTWGWLQVAIGGVQLIGGALVLARTLVGRVVAAIMALGALFAELPRARRLPGLVDPRDRGERPRSLGRHGPRRGIRMTAPASLEAQ